MDPKGKHLGEDGSRPICHDRRTASDDLVKAFADFPWTPVRIEPVGNALRRIARS
jgi:hypothetical protein